MIRIVLVILLIWVFWLGFQYCTKSQAAHMLTEKTIEEFYSTDVNRLLQGVEKGYQYKTVEINGKKFWISWFYKEFKDSIEMTGRVDFVELLPFSNFRFGSTFKSILKIK